MEVQLKLKTLERPPEVEDVDPLNRYSGQDVAVFLEKLKFSMAQVFSQVRFVFWPLLQLFIFSLYIWTIYQAFSFCTQVSEGQKATLAQTVTSQDTGKALDS